MSGRTNPYDIERERVKGYPDTLQFYRIPASRFWQVRFFTGRKPLRKSTKCENKRDAIAFAKRFFEDVKLAERLDFDIHRDTFAACANHMMKRQESLVANGERDDRIVTEDRKKLKQDILPFFGTMSVGSITATTLEDYLAYIGQRKLSPSTRSSDVLMVTKLDRLCRNVSELCRIVAGLEDKGVSLRILSIALDTATAAGKLMLNLLGAVAEFETAIMKERQREGIERAKRDGKYKGRKATARAKADEVRQLRSEGIGASAIASRLGISRASVYRTLE